jgi:CRP-like cAMP-binding protein
MNLYTCDRQVRQLRQRDTLNPTDLQQLWRLESGALRIDTIQEDNACSFVRMVLPGDLLGVESMVGVTDRLVVRALTTSRLAPVTLVDEGQTKQLLMDAISNGYRRTRELVTLRTGSTDDRVKRLLLALASTDARSPTDTAACALPSLNDIAAIVNAAPETVCRALASLRQINFLQDCSPQISKHKRLEYRQHRLQTGVAQGAAV